MARTVHKLKTVNPFYQSVQDGEKPFEIRFDDRGYKVGDYLQICEWDGERLTGRNVWRRVNYILTWGQFPGLASGYVCMGFGSTPSYETVRELLQAEKAELETRTAPEAPEQTWTCVICGLSNYATVTHCEQCEYSRMVTREGRLVPREGR